MYEFTNSVSLLGSSRDTALHLGEEELRYESRQTTVQQNSSNLLKATLSHGNLYVFYVVANSYEFVRPHLVRFV